MPGKGMDVQLLPNAKLVPKTIRGNIFAIVCHKGVAGSEGGS
jgi:hypothetical protein